MSAFVLGASAVGRFAADAGVKARGWTTDPRALLRWRGRGGNRESLSAVTVGIPGATDRLTGKTMKDYAKGFYKSKAWKETRAAYARSVGGLCEICLDKGLVRAGVIVHHREHISPENITDPRVLLDWNNLQLVCRDCHAALHKPERRYRLDELGRVIVGG